MKVLQSKEVSDTKEVVSRLRAFLDDHSRDHVQAFVLQRTLLERTLRFIRTPGEEEEEEEKEDKGKDVKVEEQQPQEEHARKREREGDKKEKKKKKKEKKHKKESAEGAKKRKSD